MVLLSLKYWQWWSLLVIFPRWPHLPLFGNPVHEVRHLKQPWLILKSCIKVWINCYVNFVFNLEESVSYIPWGNSTTMSSQSDFFCMVMLVARFGGIVFNKTLSWFSFCSFFKIHLNSWASLCPVSDLQPMNCWLS